MVKLSLGAGKKSSIKLVLDSHTTTNRIKDYKKGKFDKKKLFKWRIEEIQGSVIKVENF